MEEILAEGPAIDTVRGQYSAALAVSKSFRDADDDSIILDLTDLEWVMPSFVVPLSVALQRERSRGRDFNIRMPESDSAETYLDAVGFPFGRDGEDAELREGAMPLCTFDSEQEEIGETTDLLRELLDSRFDRLDRGILTGLNFPILEALENIQQHSQADNAAVMAQYYPERGCMDIRVCDDGVSIPGTFEASGMKFASDQDAIRRAVQEGASSKAEEDPEMERGRGLEQMADVICDGMSGNFAIYSRNGACFRNPQTLDTYQNSFWSGTVLAARLKIPDDEFDFYQYVIE